jgi:hypothetical protein
MLGFLDLKKTILSRGPRNRCQDNFILMIFRSGLLTLDPSSGTDPARAAVSSGRFFLAWGSCIGSSTSPSS